MCELDSKALVERSAASTHFGSMGGDEKQKAKSELGRSAILSRSCSDGTLSAAVKQLGAEYTTVARHIQALEDELNAALFHKSNSGYVACEESGID
jgi:endonuclease III